MSPTDTSSPSDRRQVSAVVALAVVVLSVAVLVVVSLDINDEEPTAPDLCAATQLLLDDGVRAFAIAADPDVTAGEVREGVDRVLDDLARMSDAAPDRFEVQVAQVREAVLDIRRSLLDLGDETPFEAVRLLIDETVDDATPVFMELIEGIGALCPDLEV